MNSLKRRIEQLLNGIFEYEAPELKLSTKQIDLKVRKGDRYRGSFEIESTTRKKVKGFLYASGTRMAYGPSSFSSLQEKITFEFDSAGLQEGDVSEGAFTVCSNVGEYQIPYRVTILAGGTKEAKEQAENLEDFAVLAKADFQKAYVAFVSQGFRKMLSRKERDLLPLYDGLMKSSLSYRTLEEFLIGAGKKEPVSITMERTCDTFLNLTQPTRESVALTKSTWGFLRLDISSDAEFLKVERQVVTADEFIGSTYTLDYVIDTEALHRGRNYGRIFLKSPFHTWEYVVTVCQEERKPGLRLLPAQHREVGRILEYYVDFRLKRKNIHEWLNLSQEALDRYHKAGGTNPMMELFQAQLYFAADRADEGCLLLNELDQHKEKLEAPEAYGYYLYLTTFYNKDPKYVDYVEEQMEGLLMQHQDNWKLQWFLLYLRDTYRQHPARKLEAIQRQYLYGCSSRIMYLEAYFVLEKFPMLLKRLEAFELQVLGFICRQDLMSKEISMQISDLAGRYQEYSDKLFEILNCCYEKYPTRALLQAICSILIKAHKTGSEYFSWYEKGVEADLRVTGLYEYYVESMDGSYTGPLPKMIRMYFSYQNTLSYQKKACVYANVIRNRVEDPKTYQTYRPAIEKFMLDQLKACRVNQDLALIYRTFLNKGMLNRRLADCLVKVLFTYEIQCKVPMIRQAAVFHSALKQEQCVSLNEGKANVQLYTGDYQILLIDEEENRYARPKDYELVRLLEDEELLGYCRELSPSSPGMILHECGQIRERQPINAQHMESFWNLLSLEDVKESCKEQVRQSLLDYYYKNQAEPTLYEFLHRIDYGLFIKTDKRKLVELLAAEGMCREAFELLKIYGPEQVGTIALVRICSRTILDREDAQDEMLTALCHCCFEQGKYDETVLTYLLHYYDGPIEQMKKLWRVSRQFELDAYRLEEKILLMVLFMRTGAEDTEEIFDSYRRKMGKKKWLEAYLIYRSYDYFVKEVSVKKQVFDQLERWYERGEALEEVCKLALLRYYASLEKREEKQEDCVRKLLEECCQKGMCFSFFHRFGPHLGRTYGFWDKSFVEYRTRPDASVSIRYRIEQESGEVTAEGAEPLRNLYEGIFVREVTLFQGEMLIYHIQEEVDGKMEEKTEEILIWEGNSEGKTTRYDLINRLEKALECKDMEQAKQVTLRYLEQEALAKELFPIV